MARRATLRLRLFRCEVLALDAAGAVERIASVPARPSGTGWLPDGDMLIVSQLDKRVLRLTEDGTLATHADLGELMTGPGNDMVVSASGHAYVGSKGSNVGAGEDFVAAPLVVVSPDGSAAIATEPLGFPNGPAITEDQRTLIVAETMSSRISAFDIQDDGSLGPRRDWAVFGEARTPDRLTGLPIVEVLALMNDPDAATPDGVGLHRDGSLWVADALNHRVLRVQEGGAILDVFSTGDDEPFAVALGGSAQDQLFVCVAPSSQPSERERTELSRVLVRQV